jgi:cobyrinic acid a,c-diamide synthase
MALLRALGDRGFVAAAGKAGPDYIDPAFHAAVTGRPAASLDLWMCAAEPGDDGIAGLRRIASRLARGADILVVEGAMGLYDGAHRGVGSTAQVARALGLPVLLLLDAGGCGQSVAAMAEGFLRFRQEGGGEGPEFLGIVCTHVGGRRHVRLLADALRHLEGEAPMLGALPREGAPRLPSRHLGLVEARQVFPHLDQNRMKEWLENGVDVDRLLDLLGLPPRRETGPAVPVSSVERNTGADLTVAIARDEAFSFCYGDLPTLLRELGADVVFFSPLHDAAIPPCHGILLPGGYPEECAEALGGNASMIAAMGEAAARGVPVYGECGGYVYLMESLRYRGRDHPMAGLLPGRCVIGEERAALGYRSGTLLWRMVPGDGAPVRVRGHEFHYGRLEGSSMPSRGDPLWELEASDGEDLGPDGCRIGTVAGSWLHLYPEGSRPFWRAWLAFAAMQRDGAAP